ncbi:hypothetical protein T484DRAFT_1827391, partial [Baffinella frigidus]
ETATLLWAAAATNTRLRTVVRAVLVERVITLAPLLSPHGCTAALWALATLRPLHLHARVAGVLAGRAVAVQDAFSPGHAAVLLWALVQLGVDPHRDPELLPLKRRAGERGQGEEGAWAQGREGAWGQGAPSEGDAGEGGGGGGGGDESEQVRTTQLRIMLRSLEGEPPP